MQKIKKERRIQVSRVEGKEEWGSYCPVDKEFLFGMMKNSTNE